MNARVLLQHLLEEAGPSADGGYVLALRTPGLDDLPESITVSSTSYAIRRPDTELALRREVLRSGGAPFVALIPIELARRLPPDLLRRSRQARVLQLDDVDVLGALLGVQVIGIDDPEVMQLALDYADVIKAHLTARGDTLPTAVDARLLDELLLEAVLGLRLQGTSTVSILAALLRREGELEPRFVKLLARQLPNRFGAEGRLLAWALAAEERLGALVVHGILLETDVPEPPPAVWGQLAEARGDEGVGLPPKRLRALAANLACGVLPNLGERAAGLIEEAERIGRHVLPASWLATSSVLPLGLDNRCADLARRAASGEAIGAGEIEALSEHMAHARFRREKAVLAQMARLSRYLASKPADASAPIGDLVRDYQLDGAFADMTASRLKRALAATDRFHAEASTLLERWRQRRNAQNRTFAERLAAGYTAAIHDAAVIPVHRVWQRQVMGRMAKADRGVFVVVLDGCSYPLFVELLQQLARDEGNSLGLEVASAEEPAVGLPGLAVLPSVTSHSRGALMLGEIPSDPLADELTWKGQKEAATDRARLNQNPRLGDHRRKLFLKGDLEADGVAKLTAALRDAELDVVVAVFNAVDDIISSSAVGTPLDLSVASIRGLLPALRTAVEPQLTEPRPERAPRREILVVADHGHTLFESKDLRVGKGPTARYCELDPGQSPPDGFIAIDLEGLGGTDKPLAFAWRMGTYLGQQPQVGFHGGCSLEEMVVPMVWLVPNGVPADKPVWWYGADASARRAQPEPEVAVVVDVGGEHDTGRAPILPSPVAPILPSPVQATLPHLPPAVDAKALGVPEELLASLDAVESSALAWLQQNGSATTSELARSLGIRVGRVNGLMQKLDAKLRDAGERRFRAQKLPSGEMQFELIGAKAVDQ